MGVAVFVGVGVCEFDGVEEVDILRGHISRDNKLEHFGWGVEELDDKGYIGDNKELRKFSEQREDKDGFN